MRAQATYKQLKPEVREGSFDDLVKALRQWFEPDSRCELYTAKFQTRRIERSGLILAMTFEFCLGLQGVPETWSRRRQQLCVHT